MADNSPRNGQPSAEGFAHLEDLQTYLRQVVSGTVGSLSPFYVSADGGFGRLLNPRIESSPNHASAASTATCVALLRATGRLEDDLAPWRGGFSKWTAAVIAGEWNASRLGVDNSFALAFLLEALRDLRAVVEFDDSARDVIDRKLELLRERVSVTGRIAIGHARPNAFLTYKAVSALKHWDKLEAVKDVVSKANWAAFHEESLLVASEDVGSDVFELTYSVLIASAVAPLSHMTPQQRSLLRFGLQQFFAAQRKDGGWPRSRPLFEAGTGYAFCHDHELLAALLSDRQLRPLLHPYMDKLNDAATALEERKYPLDLSRAPQYGWTSGHHADDPAAESWATAAAVHFCFALDRLVAEAIRQYVFDYAKVPYEPPLELPPDGPALPDSFLDSDLPSTSGTLSLKETLAEKFIGPLISARGDVEQGRPLRDGALVSAIFYGAPGTAKTELAVLISKALGWPLLPLDPSHLTRGGLDRVHAEANTLFGMLERCEQIVVLLDEFDELVREREAAGELESRFLTTAMLPKLKALAEERRIVYLVATNHLEKFDIAIRRPGRFAVIAPIMPPTCDAKLERWDSLKQAMDRIQSDAPRGVGRARRALHDLIFLEAKQLSATIDLTADGASLVKQFTAAGARGTLNQPFADGGKITWKKAIQGLHNRDRGLVD